MGFLKFESVKRQTLKGFFVSHLNRFVCKYFEKKARIMSDEDIGDGSIEKNEKQEALEKMRARMMARRRAGKTRRSQRPAKSTPVTPVTPSFIDSIKVISNEMNDDSLSTSVPSSPIKKKSGDKNKNKNKKSKQKKLKQPKRIIKNVMDLSSLDQIASNNARLRAYRGMAINRCRIDIPGSKKSKKKN